MSRIDESRSSSGGGETAAGRRDELSPDPSALVDLARTKMPFGRHRGRLLIDLPEPYVVWFQQRGMPRGKLGELLGLLYEIKVNGLEHIVRRAAGTGRVAR